VARRRKTEEGVVEDSFGELFHKLFIFSKLVSQSLVDLGGLGPQLVYFIELCRIKVG